MKFIAHALFVAIFVVACTVGESQNSPLPQLGRDFPLVGKLHVPLGEVVTLEGVVVEGPFKGYESGYNLRVQRIGGRATQEDIQIVIKPFFSKWGKKAPDGGIALPDLEIGATYEMEGYETGGYVGVPHGVSGRGSVAIQTTGQYFRVEFVVTKAKRIEPIVFEPLMFAGKRALIQGIAESRQGAAILIGDGWSVTVINDAPWPKHVEGKQVETWGMHNPDFDRNVFQLIDGEWRLVKLEDQLGRDVMLRGRARSLNGVWWFHYRNVDLYFEGMQDLPGWTVENHWRPMEIRGRLDKAMLPRLDQIALKLDRDLKEYFIVRDASWKPLLSLLSPERPFPREPSKFIDSDEK